jgi:hypothetical protein
MLDANQSSFSDDAHWAFYISMELGTLSKG